MLRAVLDTNILIRALITPKGTLAKIIAAWRDGCFDLATSLPLLDELNMALSRPKLSQRYHLTPQDIHDILALLRKLALVVAIGQLPRVPIADAADLVVLATAIESESDYLVTGDKQLLNLRRYGSVRIIRASEFLALI